MDVGEDDRFVVRVKPFPGRHLKIPAKCQDRACLRSMT